MNGVKMKKRNKEALPIGSAEEIRQLDRPTAAEKEQFRRAVADAVELLDQELGLYAPPYRRNLYTYLFAKAAGLTPPPEIAKEVELDGYKNYGWSIEKYNKLVGDVHGIIQQAMLAKLLKALEPVEAEYEREMERDQAKDDLIDFVHNSGLSYTEQASVYKELLEQVKNNELMVAIAS